MTYKDELQKKTEEIKMGGKDKYHQKNEEKGKLFVRKRLELLFDEDIDIEDAFCKLYGWFASIRWRCNWHWSGKRPGCVCDGK